MKRFIITAVCLLTSYHADAQQDPGPDALKAHIEKYRKAHNAANAEDIHALVVSLIPSKSDLNTAISAYVPDKTFELLDETYTPMRAITLEQVRNHARDTLSDEPIVITSATVQDLISAKPGSEIYKYFPRGAANLALDGTLNARTTFYRATIGDPVKSDTFAVELIFWSKSTDEGSKSGWRSLYPIWEKLPFQKPVYPPEIGAPIARQEAFLAGMKSRLLENQNYINDLTLEKKANQLAKDKTTHPNQKIVAQLKLIRASLKKRSCETFSKVLETRIKHLENTIKLRKLKLPSIDIDSVKKRVAIKKQIEKLEQELKFLKLANAASAAKLRTMNKPGDLNQGKIDVLKKEIVQTEAFIKAKEQKIGKLKEQLE